MEFKKLKEMKDKYEKENGPTKTFLKKYGELSEKSLLAFFDEHYKKDKSNNRIRSSSFSDRVFAWWTMQFLNDKVCNAPYSPKDDNPLVSNKKFDFFFEGRGKKKVFIEFKKNIDNIEKDLFKFWLLNGAGTDKNIITALVVWEENDNSTYKNGDRSSYINILKHAKKAEFLTEYFYLPKDNREKLIKGIKGYTTFLTELK
ncbi:MAG: hypothetical protein WC297_03815 [Candidatus Paceibacterota bacterium]